MLSEILKKSDKTIYQISKDTGIAQSTLSEWLSGKYQPSLRNAKILADYLGIAIEDFIKDSKCVR